MIFFLIECLSFLIFITVNTIFEEIGQMLRERRRHLEISQIDFAKLAGVAVHTVSDIESGKGNPTLDVLLKVLDPLGLKLSVEPRAIPSVTNVANAMSNKS